MKWLKTIDREDLKDKNRQSYVVCEAHFLPMDMIFSDKRKGLMPDVVPSLQLPHHVRPPHPTFGPKVPIKIEDDYDENACVENTRQAYPTSLENERKRKLAEAKSILATMQPVKKEVLKNTNDEALFVELCEKYLSKDLVELIKAYTYLKHRPNRLSFKITCLNLLFTSPQCYELMSNLIHLPKISTLNKINIPISTGVNEDLMKLLKVKVDNMTMAERECCIALGIMHLKSNLYYDITHDRVMGLHEVNEKQSPKIANYAAVIIVRGILSKWTQPIAYSFLSHCLPYRSKKSDDTSFWIVSIIKALFDIGLKVRALVYDQRSEFLHKPRSTPKNNVQHFTLYDNKIYYIHDIPQLMKLLRNNLMMHHFNFFNGNFAKFQDIVMFYDKDKHKSFKLAKKLTESHINPSDSEKNELRYVVELFSKTVATGISTYIDFGVIDETARGTVRLIEIMNDLFDILNSSKLGEKCKYKQPLNGEEFQAEFITKALLFLNSLEFIDARRNLTIQNPILVENCIMSVKSIHCLHQELMDEGYGHLFTRRLNQEVVDDCFSLIRSETGSEKPTCRQFVTAFRKVAIKPLLKYLKKGNRREDMSAFFLRMTDFLNIEEESQMEVEYFSLSSILRADYNKIQIPKEKGVFYVAGWLLQKCLDDHKPCVSLASYMNVNKNFHDQRAKTRFSMYREYLNEMKSDLPSAPPDDFISYVMKMERIFKDEFENDHRTSKIGHAIYEKIRMADFIDPPPCSCFPRSYLQRLFVRMRIFVTLKYNSTAFRSKELKPFDGIKFNLT